MSETSDAVFGRRIKAERLRLELSQDAFASCGGVAKSTQVAYEAGRRVPDLRYLHQLVAAGADAMFIVTGGRSEVALDPGVTQAVATALANWITHTERDVTPDLLEQAFNVLYDVATVTLADRAPETMSNLRLRLEQLLANQMRLVG